MLHTVLLVSTRLSEQFHCYLQNSLFLQFKTLREQISPILYYQEHILNLICFVKKALQLHGQSTCVIPMPLPTAPLLCDLGKPLHTSLPLFPLLSFLCRLLGLWSLQGLNCLLQCVCTAALIKKGLYLTWACKCYCSTNKKNNIPLYRWT